MYRVAPVVAWGLDDERIVLANVDTGDVQILVGSSYEIVLQMLQAGNVNLDSIIQGIIDKYPNLSNMRPRLNEDSKRYLEALAERGFIDVAT